MTNAWGRSDRRTKMDVPEIPPSPYLNSVAVMGVAYEDDASGTYGNTAGAVLESTIASLYYGMRAERYGNQREIGFQTGSSIGSWDTALDNLDDWAQLAAGGTSIRKWAGIIRLQDQQTIEEWTPGARFGKPMIDVVPGKAGGWHAFVWVPRYSRSGADQWSSGQIYSSTPIDPQRYILRAKHGLAFAMSTTPMSELINDLTIEYAYDIGDGTFHATAHCNASTSDNGFGTAWPTFASSNASPVDVCAWSQLRHGRRRFPGNKLQLYDVYDPEIAVACGMYFLGRFYRPGKLIQFEATPDMVDLQVGHILRFDDAMETVFSYPTPFWGSTTPGTGEGASWESIYWRIMHAEFDLGTKRVLASAEWYPQIIGAEISTGATGGTVGDAGEPGGEYLS